MKARYGKRGDKDQRRKEQKVIKQIAEHVAQGRPLNWLLDVLNGQKWAPPPQGTKWGRTTVERIIEANRRRMRVEEKKLEKHEEFEAKRKEVMERDAKAGLHMIEIERTQSREDRPWMGPKHSSDTEVFTEEEFQEFKLAAKAGMEEHQALVAKKALSPKDWADSRDFGWDTLIQGDYQERWLAGKDSWFREILPLVVEQMAKTGKPVLDLLAAIPKGVHPAKGEIVRLWLGVLRQFAMERETALALRAKVASLEGQLAAMESPEAREQARAQAERVQEATTEAVKAMGDLEEEEEG